MRRFTAYPTKTPEVEIEINPELNNGCKHHWRIEVANGPISKGVCKICGVSQEFHNSPENKPAGVR